MTDIGSFERFMNAEAFDQRSLRMKEAARGPFVTISRQAGAGGRSLAEALMRGFGELAEDPACVGWRLIDEAALRPVLAAQGAWAAGEDVLDEHYHGLVQDSVNQLLAGTAPQGLVLRRVFAAVRSAALSGRAVILGRAGAELTKGLAGGVRLRLVASKRSRLFALMRRYGLTRKEAEERMETLDAARAGLVRDYFHADIENPLLYDAVFNTDSVSTEELVSWVLRALKQRAAALAGTLSR